METYYCGRILYAIKFYTPEKNMLTQIIVVMLTSPDSSCLKQFYILNKECLTFEPKTVQHE